jgi:hypothetical protein
MSNSSGEIFYPVNTAHQGVIWLVIQASTAYPDNFCRELANKSNQAVLVIDCADLLRPLALQQTLKNAPPSIIVLDSSYTLPVADSSPSTWVHVSGEYLIHFLNEQLHTVNGAIITFVLYTADKLVWEQVNRAIDFGYRSGRRKVTPFAKALLRPIDGEQNWDNLLDAISQV